MVFEDRVAALGCFAPIASSRMTKSKPNQLLFVPPPVEGVISLGAYDNKGKLVRVLKKAADIDTFKSGLDGLVIEWDRNDSQGKPVPSGKYFARGRFDR